MFQSQCNSLAACGSIPNLLFFRVHVLSPSLATEGCGRGGNLEARKRPAPEGAGRIVRLKGCRQDGG